MLSARTTPIDKDSIMPTLSARKVIGVGSPIVDILARVPESFLERAGGEKGGMELVDSDAMDRLISELPELPALAPGGSAANTIFALARLGVSASLLGKLGNDDNAVFYRDQFALVNGDASRFRRHEAVATARCLSLITPDGQRTMRTDLGAAATLNPAEIGPEDFAGHDFAHIEGYLLFNRALAEAVLRAAKTAGCIVCLDLGSFEVVRAAGDILPRLLEEYVDVVFSNEDEAEAFFGTRDYADCLARFGALCAVAAVKLGADGALIHAGGNVHTIRPIPVPSVLDTTGAGDYWASGFLLGHLLDRPWDECGRFGAVLGSEVVQRIGADLDDAGWTRVRTALAL